MDVVVVGSINWDISVLTPRLPGPGETIQGTRHFAGPGGKGANQAVAAARLGARVALVGRVGDDENGKTLLAGLSSEGVDVSAVVTEPDLATGLAVITIDDAGENTIVASPGANAALSPADLAVHERLVSSARVVIAQLEVPTETVVAASRMTTGQFVLNPAPARQLPDELLSRVAVLVPNRSELGLLAGTAEPLNEEEVRSAAGRLRLPNATVVTLGEEGAFLMEAGTAERFPSPVVEAVDPTGAGDAFCGALAFSLSRCQSLHEAVRWATGAGAIAVTRHGAQSALPTRTEIEELLAR